MISMTKRNKEHPKISMVPGQLDPCPGNSTRVVPEWSWAVQVWDPVGLNGRSLQGLPPVVTGYSPYSYGPYPL